MSNIAKLKLGLIVLNFSAFIGLIVTIAFIERVPVGHVGIIVNLLGSDKGVTTEEVGPGRQYVGFNQKMYIFPTFTQTIGWTRDSNPEVGSATNEEMSFQTADGLVVTADVGASISIDPSKVNILFQKYRKGMDEIVDSYVRRNIQDALVRKAGQMGVESVYGAGKNELIQAAYEDVKSEMAQLGIIIEKLYWIGQIRLPDLVVDAINKKISATQEAEQRRNEVEKAKAQANIEREKAQGEADALLIAAKAQAEANKQLSQSLTKELNEYNAITKWDGKVPQYMTGPVPFVNLQK